MATIALENVRKVYPNGFNAVKGVDLHIADGEMMVLVGPSGCGKTTVLRMIAGLEETTDGVVRFGDQVVTNLPPAARDIAMVFQNYALYPHMTVAENIGFALRLRKMPKGEIAHLVEETARVLALTEWLERRPAQLSGGQRQRVAMGRAIVRRPAAFLMDEPLSNLDAKLRVQMRAEVASIQRTVGVATVYVTHDQTEAMTLGDRVAVMRDGRVLQCDTPQVLYDRPANMFVGAFIGSPAMNLFEATLNNGKLHLGSQTVALPRRVFNANPHLAYYNGKTVVLGLRPESLSAADDTAEAVIAGAVELVEALGNELQVHFSIDARRILAEEPSDADALANAGAGVARVPPRVPAKVGEQISFCLDLEALHFFDPESQDAIGSWADQRSHRAAVPTR